jgi:hypothetical protein
VGSSRMNSSDGSIPEMPHLSSRRAAALRLAPDHGPSAPAVPSPSPVRHLSMDQDHGCVPLASGATA